MKKFSQILFTALIFGVALPAFSQTLVVGSCKTSSHPYTTIQSAVNAAPAYADILVCPGTYPEQLTITTPLTLTGISTPLLTNPIITAPAAGLTENFPSGAAMIAVATHGSPGSVNIQGLVLDGTNCSSSAPAGHTSGIRYISTSGTVEGTVIQHTNTNCNGFGIGVENDDHWTVNVTAKDNVIRGDPSSSGIEAVSGPSSSTLNFQVLNNVIYQVNTGLEFHTNGKGVYASGNIIEPLGEGAILTDGSVIDTNVVYVPGEGSLGISVLSKRGSITGNIVMTGGTGIGIDSGSNNVTVSSNKILGDIFGIASPEPGIINLSPTSNLQSNMIGELATGIQTVCGATVIGNTILGTTTGIDGAPAGQANNYVDVTTPQTSPCP